MEFERVKLDVDGNVGVLTLNHPEVMNAVSPEMLGGLMRAMDAVEDPKNGLRCLVMTGEGRGFCTGANLQGRGDNSGARPDAGSCAKSSYFLQAFRRIGLVPDGGSTWILPRLVGKARAMELSLLGEKLPAETALQWGLVNRVFDDETLMAEARKLAADLANGPTKALGMIRQLYWESTDNTYEEQLNLERQLQRTAGNGDDFKEGVRAFLEKRPAEFKGN